MTSTNLHRLLLAAALAATFAVFTAALAVWRMIGVENDVLGARRACDCCEESGR